jgi:adenylate cyclase
LCEFSKNVPGQLVASSDAIANASESERARWHLGETVTLRGHDEPTQLATPV